MSKKSHISRLAAPRTWPIERKGIKWIIKPSPGTHNLVYSVPLALFLRDLIKVAKTAKEAKKILSKGLVKINNKIIRKEKFPVGIFDVVTIPSMKKNWRIVLSKKGKLSAIEILESDSKFLPVKIISKTTLKKGKKQLNLSNGWNLLSDKAYKVGDVLILNLENKSIDKHISLEKGNLVYVIGGKHIGRTAVLRDIQEKGTLRKEKIAILEAEKEKWQSPLGKLFAIGKKEPEIKLQ